MSRVRTNNIYWKVLGRGGEGAATHCCHHQWHSWLPEAPGLEKALGARGAARRLRAQPPSGLGSREALSPFFTPATLLSSRPQSPGCAPASLDEVAGRDGEGTATVRCHDRASWSTQGAHMGKPPSGSSCREELLPPQTFCPWVPPRQGCCCLNPLQLWVCAHASGTARSRQPGLLLHRNCVGKGSTLWPRVAARVPGRLLGWVLTLCPAVLGGQQNHQLAGPHRVAHRWTDLKNRHSHNFQQRRCLSSWTAVLQKWRHFQTHDLICACFWLPSPNSENANRIYCSLVNAHESFTGWNLWMSRVYISSCKWNTVFESLVSKILPPPYLTLVVTAGY